MAESVSSITTQLAAVDVAIAAAETAQSAGSDGTSLTRASLDVLYKRRDTLQQRLESAEAASAGYNRMFARGRTRFMGGI